jgi:hypothetical protein
MVLSGLSGDPKGAYARNMRDWAGRFVALMLREKVPAGNIAVLAEAADPAATPPAAKGDLAGVRSAFEALSARIRPQDQFVLFIVGHGAVTEPVGKICLPGPDLNANELAKLLDGLLTRNVVVINCASGGAEVLAKCARPGRVIVSAAGAMGQGVQTYFAEFFLMGCETRQADKDGDGKITVLEAFNWSAGACVDWYHRQSGVKSKLEEAKRTRDRLQLVNVYGKETARLFRKFYEGTNVKLNEEGSRLDDPDADMSDGSALADTMKGDGRETMETASIEDRGEPAKAALHWVDSQHVVLTGKAGEEGETAAKTFLGHPAAPATAGK